MTLINYAGGSAQIDLTGNAGQEFQLTTGAGLQTVNYAWDPRDGSVCDLECRIQVLAAVGSSALTSYLVLYKTEVSAGESVFNEPRTKIFNRTETVNEHILPDRGIVFRLNAKRFKLAFRLVQLVAPLTSVNLMVSVQPSMTGSEPPQLPPITLGRANLALTAIPLTAKRFRVRRSDGQPFVAAANTFTIYTLVGRSLGLVDCANYADWTPVPTLASFLLFNVTDAILEYE